MKYIRRFNESLMTDDDVELLEDYFLDLIEKIFPSSYTDGSKPFCKVDRYLSYANIHIVCLSKDRDKVRERVDKILEQLKRDYIILRSTMTSEGISLFNVYTPGYGNKAKSMANEIKTSFHIAVSPRHLNKVNL